MGSGNQIKNGVAIAVLTSILVGSGTWFLTSYARVAVADEKIQTIEESVAMQGVSVIRLEKNMAVAQQVAAQTTENLKILTNVVKEVVTSVNDLKIVSERHDVKLEQDK